MQGPAELLPVSSSGHLALLAGSSLDGELRKSFEVALHAGTAAALVIVLGRELRLPHPLSVLPAGAAGLLFERPIEQSLGSPRAVGVAQIAAGAALAAADLLPAERSAGEARPVDELLIGVAQAVALVPGVSRSGATLTAARLLRFARRDANVLSRRASLPVIVGATGLKALRLWQRGLPRELGAPFAAGAVAAFASTLVASPLVRLVDGARSYLPFAAYRVALGAVALIRFNGAHG